MKPSAFRYALPSTLRDAIDIRARFEDSVILAGGQSLIPTMNFRLANPEVVIDLRKLDELNYVRVADGVVRIGAMARQRVVEQNDEVAAANPLIRETLLNVAHPVIRNRGTVGGSLAHADPSAELPTLLTTMRGAITVCGPSGSRTIAAEDFFEFIFTTVMEPDELLVEAAIPALEPGEGWAFAEFARRHGDYSVAGVAVTLKLGADRRIDRVRLGACGIATTPALLTECERLLTGKSPSPELFAEAGALARDAVTVSDDSATSKAYRQHVLAGLVERNLTTAMTRTDGA
ncbi:FAD binding domain-containing protein [Streptosporangium sp. NBC_01755]|uniref:FAD binding domain-containing protein n=1 Tax=unclassified Streptosporangium TaxID=2632669 RepID=UPI002DD7A2FB|nr:MULTISPECIES: FAD binding domain-containing protein [unclassified Streptosporangium]WSA27909.1 FAD binding domain-containing protein [Streptosporangium sp. NBC_01810]WSD00619.1 FAD binding domain-containing protein [Streptosporangium sp. NBC_01755]